MDGHLVAHLFVRPSLCGNKIEKYLEINFFIFYFQIVMDGQINEQLNDEIGLMKSNRIKILKKTTTTQL